MKKNAEKAKRSFIRLVRANVHASSASVLLTLTFKEIVTAADGYKCYTKFLQKLRRKYPDISAIAVPEYQKRGSIHFHVLVFGLDPQIALSERESRYIAKMWGRGFVDLVLTDNSPKLAGYLAKYMSKAFLDERFSGVKAYSATRNVERPMSTNMRTIYEHKELLYGELAVENEIDYGTRYMGQARYTRYKINP